VRAEAVGFGFGGSALREGPPVWSLLDPKAKSGKGPFGIGVLAAAEATVSLMALKENPSDFGGDSF
jgi:hypothetical protein